jgi:hypothetical protein
MDGKCGICGRDENRTQSLVREFKERNVGDPAIEGVQTGRWILKESCVKMQTGLMRFGELHDQVSKNQFLLNGSATWR